MKFEYCVGCVEQPQLIQAGLPTWKVKKSWDFCTFIVVLQCVVKKTGRCYAETKKKKKKKKSLLFKLEIRDIRATNRES